MNSLFLFAFITLIVVFLVALVSNELKNIDEDEWPFYAKPLMTKPEQVLYFKLLKALPDCMIFSQVQLSRFLGVKKGYPFNKWFNRINRMSADFVICAKDSSIIAIIELDDSSHNNKKRMYNDNKKDNAIRAAKLLLVRIKVKEIPSENELRKLIEVQK